MPEAIALSIEDVDSDSDWGDPDQVVTKARAIDTQRRRRNRRR